MIKCICGSLFSKDSSVYTCTNCGSFFGVNENNTIRMFYCFFSKEITIYFRSSHDEYFILETNEGMYRFQIDFEKSIENIFKSFNRVLSNIEFV